MRSLLLLGSVVVGLSLFTAGCSDSDAAGQGAGGAGGGAGNGAGGGAPADGSQGCGQPSAQLAKEWVEKTVDVEGTARTYFVYLPDNYEPTHPYPVVYQFHGCSDQHELNNVPVQDQSGDAAIHVRGRAITNCWEDATDVAFFDAMVAEIEQTYCADTVRRFATGYSSGSFLAQQLACERGDVLRAVATIAGGNAGRDCTGKVASLQIHDLDDTTVPIAGGEELRDQLAERSGCDLATARAPTEPSPCEAYAGCDEGYPVVWCPTSGNGHERQDSLAAPAFWDFLSQF
jgi:polyhydroxybutyrate depolymerase